MELLIPRIPPFVRSPRRPYNEFTRSSELWLATKYLMPETPAGDASAFLLKVVHVHRRAGTRLSDAIGFHTFTRRPWQHTLERQALTVSVVDCVRVSSVHFASGDRLRCGSYEPAPA